MKILHLIYDHSGNPWVGGGGAVRVYELSRRLARKGHDITVVSGKYPGSEDYAEGSLKYRFVGSESNYLFSTLLYAFAAARFVMRHGSGFDVLIEDFAPWNPVFSSLLTKRPVVLHVNHREGFNILRRWPVRGLPFYLIDTFYPGLFRHVTALSEWTRRKIKVPDATILPAGVNSSMLDKGALDVEDRGDYILYVGRLHIKNKGLDTLMEAMRSVKGARLVVAGRGGDEDRLRAMASGLDVEFAGFVDEKTKIELVRGAKLFILPSRFEGWGIVVLEAAACGKAVVVSDIPELSFAVDAGFGVSFSTGDPDDLAEKTNSLLERDEERLEMGHRAERYAMDYTWDGIAGKCEGMLLGIIEAGR
jgi:glycosyltransferase involved in cell wall biosynthesis